MTDEPLHDHDAPVDLGRRTFFRHLGRNAVRAAGNAAGTVQAVRRGSVAAAGGLLGFGFDPTDTNPETTPEATLPSPPIWAGREAAPRIPGGSAAAGVFRSPYRLDGDLIVLVDQWRLPEELIEVACADAADVARAMTDAVVRGAPVLAQVGAFGLALTVRSARSLTPDERDAAVRAAAATLVAARRSAQPLAYAVRRMLARWDAVRNRLDLDAAADAMRTEAEAIISEASLDHARLARLAAAALPTPAGRSCGVLVHGNAGALAGGHVGTALGVVQRLVADGRPVHVWATESRPSLDGARLTTLELDRMGAPYTRIADAMAGWVLANEAVDAVLLGADCICRNGDTANTVGSFPIAAAAEASGVPVYVCAPSSTIAPDYLDGAAIPADTDAQGQALCDIVPGSLISALFTEDGRVLPAAEEQLRAAYQRSAQRRLPHGGSPSVAAMSA